jgi:hypothetical protein
MLRWAGSGTLRKRMASLVLERRNDEVLPEVHTVVSHPLDQPTTHPMGPKTIMSLLHNQVVDVVVVEVEAVVVGVAVATTGSLTRGRQAHRKSATISRLQHQTSQNYLPLRPK